CRDKVDELLQDKTLKLSDRKTEIMQLCNSQIKEYEQTYASNFVAQFPQILFLPNQKSELTYFIIIFFFFIIKKKEIARCGKVGAYEMNGVKVSLKSASTDNITIEWENEKGKISRPYNEMLNADSFLIEYRKVKSAECNVTSEDEKWSPIQVTKSQNHRWEHCVEDLEMGCFYAIRIKPVHTSFEHCQSPYSNTIIAQTSFVTYFICLFFFNCPCSLLSFSADRIFNFKDIQLENNNSLVRRVYGIGVLFVCILHKLQYICICMCVHTIQKKIRNEQGQINLLMLGVANGKKKFSPNSYLEKELWGWQGNGEMNDSNLIEVFESPLDWRHLRECTVDMYFHVDKKELKWKQVTESGNGSEYVLKNSLTFKKYANMSFVPHISLYATGTTVQVMKIPAVMYGLGLSQTATTFN
ncbi:hypothetical protein RFI_01886, partial [Reticulomyxa filosa]